MNIKHILRNSVVLIAGAMAVTACDTEQDWEVDSSTARLFGTTELSVDPSDTQVAVTFTKVQGAEGYQFELSTDSLYLDDVSSSSIVEVLTNSPDTIYNLMGETKYYLRMRSIAEGQTSSKWVYYESTSGRNYFTTDAEQIFYATTSADYDDENITVNWDTSKEATSLVLYRDGETVQTVALSSSDLAAGTYTFTGLNPTTTYTIEIYNGDTRRGTLTVTTAVAMPAANYRVTISEDVEYISQDMIDQYAEEAQAAAGSTTNYSVTIAIPAGMTVGFHGLSDTDGSNTNIKLPDGMSVTFFGLSGGETPVINAEKCLDISGSHAYVRFQNVQINDGGCQYLINQSSACTVAELSFTDVTVVSLARSLVRLQSSDTKVISKLTLDNVYVMSQGSGAYAMLYFNNSSYTVSEIEVKNSTLTNLQHSFIACSGATVNTITISDCTFYNIIGSGRYFCDANNNSTNVDITNCVFGLSLTADNSRGIRTAGTATMSNSYLTSDFTISSNASAFSQATTLETDAASLFADPTNGDFTLTTSLGAGDPEWYPASE